MTMDSRIDAVDESIAHTARTYDALPYDSKPVFRTHPARIAAVAHMFGLKAPPVATARILELGCAGGGNLLPLAAFHPKARFLGIDLGRRMIEDGQRRIAELGLKNIELRHQSITDLGDDDGPFDYIVCHGVYSWVPEPVREAILALCNRLLAPDGVAYVSYNVLPGWRMFQPLRDAIRRMVPASEDEAGRARQGRALIDFLAEATPDDGAYGGLLRAAPGRLAEFGDDYLFHEYMEPVNEPCLFADFAAAAQRHDLGYLGEAELPIMFPERHGPKFAARVRKKAIGVLAQQELIDVLTGNDFRTSLLVRQEAAGAIDHSDPAARLEGLHFNASDVFTLERGDDKATLVARDGRSFAFDDPVTMKLLGRIFRPVPGTVSLADLRAGFSADEAARAMKDLMVMIVNGVVSPAVAPIRAAPLGKRPRASAIARNDAAADRPFTSSVLHSPVELDTVERFLIPLLDGKADHAKLEKKVVAALADGRLVLHEPGDAPPPAAHLPLIAKKLVAGELASIAASGLLDG